MCHESRLRCGLCRPVLRPRPQRNLHQGDRRHHRQGHREDYPESRQDRLRRNAVNRSPHPADNALQRLV